MIKHASGWGPQDELEYNRGHGLAEGYLEGTFYSAARPNVQNKIPQCNTQKRLLVLTVY